MDKDNGAVMEAPNEKESDRLQVRRCSSSSLLAMAGAKASRLESLDYEINESDLLKQDELLQCVFLKWALAFLVGFLTGAIAFLINFAIENIAGGRCCSPLVSWRPEVEYLSGFLCFAGMNLGLTATAAFLCEMFAPTAAGPGIPEIKAYLNGVDTPNFFGASTLILKIDLRPHANTTPVTVVETMSAAKAAVLFRNCAKSHLLVVPKHQGERISPVVGILTQKDLRAQKLLAALPQFARKFD